ncbi:MAG: RCC1 domain-containing protein, partial [Parabacteroides sp.]|nr:RCC1 domain-containing protein [Parabacteroides sp.]
MIEHVVDEVIPEWKEFIQQNIDEISIDEAIFFIDLSIKDVPADFATSILNLICCFAYVDGKFDDEVSQMLSNTISSSMNVFAGTPEDALNDFEQNYIDALESIGTDESVINTFKPDIIDSDVEFTYNEGKIYHGECYSMIIPDCFNYEPGRDDRDFVAWLPNPKFPDDFSCSMFSIMPGKQQPFDHYNDEIKLSEIYAKIWEFKILKTASLLGTPNMVGTYFQVSIDERVYPGMYKYELIGSYLTCDLMIFVGNGLKQFRFDMNCPREEDIYKHIDIIEKLIQGITVKEQPFEQLDSILGSKYASAGINKKVAKEWAELFENHFDQLAMLLNANGAANQERVQLEINAGVFSEEKFKEKAVKCSQDLADRLDKYFDESIEFLNLIKCKEYDNKVIYEMWKKIEPVLEHRRTMSLDINGETFKFPMKSYKTVYDAWVTPEIKRLIELEEAPDEWKTMAKNFVKSEEYSEADLIAELDEKAQTEWEENIKKKFAEAEDIIKPLKDATMSDAQKAAENEILKVKNEVAIANNQLKGWITQWKDLYDNLDTNKDIDSERSNSMQDIEANISKAVDNADSKWTIDAVGDSIRKKAQAIVADYRKKVRYELNSINITESPYMQYCKQKFLCEGLSDIQLKMLAIIKFAKQLQNDKQMKYMLMRCFDLEMQTETLKAELAELEAKKFVIRKNKSYSFNESHKSDTEFKYTLDEELQSKIDSYEADAEFDAQSIIEDAFKKWNDQNIEVVKDKKTFLEEAIAKREMAEQEAERLDAERKAEEIRRKKARTKRTIIIAVIIAILAAGTVIALNIMRSNEAEARLAEIRPQLPQNVIDASYDHTVALKTDGTVVAEGRNIEAQCNVSKWKDIVAVSAGPYHTVGLKSNGTVVAVGYDEYDRLDVAEWSNIVDVAAAQWMTVGLKSD